MIRRPVFAVAILGLRSVLLENANCSACDDVYFADRNFWTPGNRPSWKECKATVQKNSQSSGHVRQQTQSQPHLRAGRLP